MPECKLTSVWEECFSRLPELENLRGVALIFDRHGGTNGDVDFEQDILQSRETRLGWIEGTFLLLGTKLKGLSVRNFQDYFYFEDVPSLPAEARPHAWRSDLVHIRHFEFTKAGKLPDDDHESRAALRKRVLGGLESLRLSVTHEQIRGEFDSHLKVCIAILAPL
jgi:hypothetical protein